MEIWLFFWTILIAIYGPYMTVMMSCEFCLVGVPNDAQGFAHDTWKCCMRARGFYIVSSSAHLQSFKYLGLWPCSNVATMFNTCLYHDISPNFSESEFGQGTSKHSVPRKASALLPQLLTVEHAMRSSKVSATLAVAAAVPTTPRREGFVMVCWKQILLSWMLNSDLADNC